MNPRNSRGNRSDSNFSPRHRDETPNQWTAYGRSEDDRMDRNERWSGSDSDRTEFGGSGRRRESWESSRDYDTSRDYRTRDTGNRWSTGGRENQDRYGSSYAGDERQHELNHYPHSYGEYDSHRDLENRNFRSAQGSRSYLNDRSHDMYEDSGEMYRPSFGDSRSSSQSFMNGSERAYGSGRSYGSERGYGADRGYGSNRSSSESSFSGRGPKGFKRSDERIKEEVCEILTRDHSIDAEDIDVEVKDGEVTLTGSVPDRRMKHMAEDCVERALGVNDVVNNIRVKRESSSSTSSDKESQSLTGDRTVTDKKSAGRTGSSITNPNH